MLYQYPGKPALVLVHGWGANSSCWPIGRLSMHFSLLVIDYSRLSKAQRDVQFFSSLLSAFVKKSGFRNFVLLGHSMGGMIAMQYAMASPEKIRGLLLVGSFWGNPLPELPFLKFNPFRMLNQNMSYKLVTFFIKLGKSFTSERDVDLSQEAPGSTYESIRLFFMLPSLSHLLEGAFFLTHYPKPDFSKLKMPVQILHTQHDDLVPVSSARLLKRSIKKSKLKILSKGNHVWFLKYPDILVRETTRFSEKLT